MGCKTCFTAGNFIVGTEILVNSPYALSYDLLVELPKWSGERFTKQIVYVQKCPG